MHRGAGAFAGRVEAGDGRTVPSLRHHLTLVVGRDAAHLVVAGRHDRDRRLIGSMPANWIEISRMPGRRFMMVSGGRCVMSSGRESLFGPQPRPSLISVTMARETTSREARSWRSAHSAP